MHSVTRRHVVPVALRSLARASRLAANWQPAVHCGKSPADWLATWQARMCSNTPPSSKESGTVSCRKTQPPPGGDSGEATSAVGTEGQTKASKLIFKTFLLWPHFLDAKRKVDACAVIAGSGLGLALLGVAPYTAPTPFLLAVFLAVVQVRLTHAVQVRQLRAHLRRHVEALRVKPKGESSTELTIVCSGALVRVLHLVDAGRYDDHKPPIKDILKHGASWIAIGRAPEYDDDYNDKERFQALFSSSKIVQEEELIIGCSDDESIKEAKKGIQRLDRLTREDIEAVKQGERGHTVLLVIESCCSSRVIAKTIRTFQPPVVILKAP
eukprot:TRINITY_DN26081_c0_g1_i5.p1 TRINITY_DN26081_c0_g1~~TRINITY_DN26081_c0_g1_i5.p1  ORF type:complete len:325 (+),score=26.07 TRINITY_DN26081_c0_g1_i5:73-1047(+)